jgi:peptidoglycan/LPS O-acetylase OafA/YrhL
MDFVIQKKDNKHLPVTTDEMLTTAPSKKHYLFLDGMRGAAAVYVTLYHFLAWNSNGLSKPWSLIVSLFRFGHTSVSVFIVLSGFSLALPLARMPGRRLKGGIAEYFRRRAIRILPPYYCALGLSMLFDSIIVAVAGRHSQVGVSYEYGVGDLLSHVFLVHNLTDHWLGSINMALWSVATEWQIYFIFPFVLIPVWRRLGIVATVAVGLVLGLVPMLVWRNSFNACFWFVGLFSIGMAAAVLGIEGANFARLTVSRRFTAIMVSVVFAAFLIVQLRLTAVNGGFWQMYLGHALSDTIAGIGIALFLLHLLMCAQHGSVDKPSTFRFLENKVFVALGKMSYSLYLTHCAVLGIVILILTITHCTPNQMFFFKAFIGVPIALLVGRCFYEVFEKPFLARRDVSEGPPKYVKVYENV